jgi:hypothetical protein
MLPRHSAEYLLGVIHVDRSLSASWPLSTLWPWKHFSRAERQNLSNLRLLDTLNGRF